MDTITIPKYQQIKQVFFKRRVINDGNQECFREEISKIGFGICFRETPDETVQSFNEMLLNIYNKAFPVRTVKIPNNLKPWRDEYHVKLLKRLAKEGRTNSNSIKWKNLKKLLMLERGGCQSLIANQFFSV